MQKHIKKFGAQDISDELPERCYGLLLSTGKIIIIARGESGYYNTSVDTGDKETNRQIVDEYNEHLGVSKAQAAAMMTGSMFGWDVPGAKPSAYDINGNLRKAGSRASLDEQIKGATVSGDTVEMSYIEMKRLFRAVEDKQRQKSVTGYVVFTSDSFDKEYDELSRTYSFSSNNKAFQSEMGGYSIFAGCLDGTDMGVRLDAYMFDEKGGRDGWKIERCYMKREDHDKALQIIDGRNREEVR